MSAGLLAVVERRYYVGGIGEWADEVDGDLWAR
jgi:hypothetical protein